MSSLSKMRSKFLEPSVVSRDNNLYVVGDISKKCLDTTETNNYQVCFAQKINVKTESIAAHSELGGKFKSRSR